ncbi:MAG: ABC transporter ATP-binding protein [Pseudomonadota bacterium]
MLEATALRSGYGRVPVLDGIDLKVEEGAFVGILGHNGMGKTTLLRTFTGHLPATAGTVRLSGEDVTRYPPHRRARLGMGLVPQGREIFPNLSVADNLRMGILGAGGNEAAVLPGLLETFPRLTRLLDRRGGALSGGEQQLLALARCLAGRPKLMLLDEPTEGIQPSIIDEIIETLQAIRAREPITLILVEQNLDFIGALADRVLIINKGRFVGELEPDQLSDMELVGEFVGFAT